MIAAIYACRLNALLVMLVFAVLLTAAPHDAEAECAWVLWTEEEITVKKKGVWWRDAHPPDDMDDRPSGTDPRRLRNSQGFEYRGLEGVGKGAYGSYGNGICGRHHVDVSGV